MKKIIGIMGCVCLLAGILALPLSLYKNREKEEKPPTSKYRDEGWFPGEYAAYAVREKYPTDILWIGPWEEYEWELPVRFAETVDRETLTMRDGFRYMYIVVNDLESSVTLTEEEYRLTNAYVKSDSRYHFLYLGKERLAEICDYGFGDKEQITNIDYSVGMYHRGERLVSVWGVYTQYEIDYEARLCEYVIGGLECRLPQE
ncbi:MAG: hypothetical protein Q4C48_05415 [Lachnospiraceae bacterium]|nr:hypothetical protein [Lachnospiraceae bacterium]